VFNVSTPLLIEMCFRLWVCRFKRFKMSLWQRSKQI